MESVSSLPSPGRWDKDFSALHTIQTTFLLLICFIADAPFDLTSSAPPDSDFQPTHPDEQIVSDYNTARRKMPVYHAVQGSPPPGTLSVPAVADVVGMF
ncbi:hypothetical protein [Paenibacillus apis]|uniref:hypothetical protein n=1 Tax=Paenibacillus apis TaxID=1792174 RepID=UPI002658030C|nr:hypothetical protein [Paenibacillus apis]